jgi:thiamine biosynthesis lipoprotein
VQQGSGSQHAREPWRPEFDHARHAVRVGPEPIDLGGIGKGLAVRWAAETLAETWPSFLITAGGDCYLAGGGPEGLGWQVGVEDPRAPDRHIAVLNISDAGCATSSTRVRRWTTAGRTVHHLIDPRTDAPGASGLSAVTVVGPDTAVSEVWSKVLFLRGSDGIAEAATAHGLAALWITEDGSVGISDAMDSLVIWQAAA